ncbi:MAG: c-type cytochrome domain-containing protein, partial [Planctomycetia bacterium]
MPFPRAGDRLRPEMDWSLPFRIPPAAKRPASITAAVVIGLGFALLAVGPAVAEPSARPASVKDIRELLDQADELRKEGKPAQAAARVAEAAQGIEALANRGAAAAGLRNLWERCRALRDDLELEDVDVSGIVLAPLTSAGKSPAKNSGTATPKPTPGDAKPAAGVKPGPPAAAGKPAGARGKPAAAAGKPAAKPALTFSAQVAPILSRHCGGCHIAGRKGGFQMVSYAGLMKSGVVQPGVGESSRLVEVILSGDMPRGGGKVSPEEIGLLIKWIDAGAPYDGTDPNLPIDGLARQATAPPPAVPPTKPVVAVKLKPGEVSFAADVATVLVANCVGCHDIEQPDGNLSMVTFDRLLRGGRGGSPVAAGKGADSLLVKKLKGAGIEGQRMPLGKPPLAADVIARIEKWIDEGARLDLLSPQAELETLAAVGRAQKLSHDELREVRFKAGRSLWTRAIPDEKATVLERGDVLVAGNLSAARMEQLAEAAEAVDRRLRDEVMGDRQPLLKGGIVVFGFAQGYDLSSFWQTVFADDRPKALTAVAGISGDVAYAAFAPPGGGTGSGKQSSDGRSSGGKSGGGKSSGGKGDGAADIRAVLTEQMTVVALIGRGVPAWFAKGAGRAVAMKAEPKADVVEAWRRELPTAVQRGGSPADFFAGHGDPAVSVALGGGFVGTIMPSAGKLAMLVDRLDDGMPFDQAFVAVFRSPPQPLFEAWMA